MIWLKLCIPWAINACVSELPESALHMTVSSWRWSALYAIGEFDNNCSDDKVWNVVIIWWWFDNFSDGGERRRDKKTWWMGNIYQVVKLARCVYLVRRQTCWGFAGPEGAERDCDFSVDLHQWESVPTARYSFKGGYLKREFYYGILNSTTMV